MEELSYPQLQTIEIEETGAAGRRTDRTQPAGCVRSPQNKQWGEIWRTWKTGFIQTKDSMIQEVRHSRHTVARV